MTNNSLPNFPQSLNDTFAKSWITYKSLWFTFFSFMLLFHSIAALVFLIFQTSDNLLFNIHFTDFSRFYISKMGDAFACFLLPLFLKNKLPSLPYIFKEFFSKYWIKLSFVVLLLYLLKTQSIIYSGSIFLNSILFVIGLVFSFMFLFVVFFIVVEVENKIFFYFKASWQLCEFYTLKILGFFISAFLFVKFIALFLLILFFSGTNILPTDLSDSVKFQENLLFIIQSTEFYFVGSGLHILLQPFLSIFLCILFYSLWHKHSTQG